MGESAFHHVYGDLTQPEVRFLHAAVERLTAADELGPGAKEADFTIYIDRHLCSVRGAHGRNYRSGPCLDGTPHQDRPRP
jgi:gluconate 2-dehydrogenase gamma chain